MPDVDFDEVVARPGGGTAVACRLLAVVVVFSRKKEGKIVIEISVLKKVSEIVVEEGRQGVLESLCADEFSKGRLGASEKRFGEVWVAFDAVDGPSDVGLVDGEVSLALHEPVRIKFSSSDIPQQDDAADNPEMVQVATVAAGGASGKVEEVLVLRPRRLRRRLHDVRIVRDALFERIAFDAGIFGRRALDATDVEFFGKFGGERDGL